MKNILQNQLNDRKHPRSVFHQIQICLLNSLSMGTLNFIYILID